MVAHVLLVSFCLENGVRSSITGILLDVSTKKKMRDDHALDSAYLYHPVSESPLPLTPK